MPVSLSDRERRLIARFEDETGATAVDCVVFEGDEPTRVVFVVAAGEMGQAIGPGGRRVDRLESLIGGRVELVEDAATAAAFVANALAPAAVRHVTVSEQGEGVAYAEVPPDDRGVAIGREGRKIETARLLAARHHDLGDVELA
jgi:N utilization substance protein A